jgi:hypothetical protein
LLDETEVEARVTYRARQAHAFVLAFPMHMPEIYFTIWWSPHKAWGYLVNIISMPDDQIRTRILPKLC